jgi:hypothetical protein
MDTHPTRRTASIATSLVLAALVASSSVVGAQVRRSGRQVTPEQAFSSVWIVDRALPEAVLWQTMVRLTSTSGFQPIVLHEGSDELWSESLSHLLWVLPQGDSIWVSDRETVFDVDLTLKSHEVPVADPAAGPAVFSADPDLDPVAALIAMRLDGRLVFEPPVDGAPAVLVGVDGRTAGQDIVLPTRTDAVAYANGLADGRAVVVARSGAVFPEHVLWAFQRDAKLIEVAVPADYSMYDSDSEIEAVGWVRDQIHGMLPQLIPDGHPSALVIAGDWHVIPFRFPRGNPHPCAGCDNGMYEYPADLEYANLDRDPWGEPDVPVGRLMSPHRDLLAIQSVLGLWREHGAFRTATDGVVLDLLGPRGGLRDDVVDAWREAFGAQLWTAVGPDEADPAYRLDHAAFLTLADRADVVVIHGHGHPDYLTADGRAGLFNQSISGTGLLDEELTGGPSFWFIHACATGKPDHRDHRADQTLLVGLQRRLAYGSLMAAEIVGSGSADPWWWTTSVDAETSVGELVRRFVAASIAVYRDGGDAGPGMPGATGTPDTDRWNALGVLTWIGDPLTPTTVDSGN